MFRYGLPLLFLYALGISATTASVNVAMMTDEEIHEKLQRDYVDAEAGNVKEAAELFAKFREKV